MKYIHMYTYNTFTYICNNPWHEVHLAIQPCKLTVIIWKAGYPKSHIQKTEKEKDKKIGTQQINAQLSNK